MSNKSMQQLIESGKCNLFSEACDRNAIFLFFATAIGPSLPLFLPQYILGTDPQTLTANGDYKANGGYESTVGLPTC